MPDVLSDQSTADQCPIASPTACSRCPNDTRNPTIRLSEGGLCQVCERFAASCRPEALDRELDQVMDLVGTGSGRYDALVGVSGGKDSTAALVRAIGLGFTPLAFTFDTGYYTEHIVPRARRTAAALGVDHQVIDLRPSIRASDRESYALTSDLYGLPESHETAQRFRDLYVQGRRRYSVRAVAAMPYVRACQVCRRLVVRAYYREAVARGVRAIILGTNEWVGLSQNPNDPSYRFSAIRPLRPAGAAGPVFVIHLPFLLRATITDTRRVLDQIGWSRPDGEDLVESNANSCLLSRAAEAKATRMLGFHPDTTRLAREVTAGFLTRDQAAAALEVPHEYPRSVRDVLTDAGILTGRS